MKRYVTRQYLWNGFYTWGVWDKTNCQWIVNDRIYRQDALKIADQLNKQGNEKVNLHKGY